ncbi:MAG: iron-containing alcohol dehydrogenase [Pseudomonadota bacterium]|nr:iron-containing alcohol dehydrogenase [Pseudomonadota bacterium]
MTLTRFSFPTTIHFGPGASGLAGAHLAGRGLHRPLIVTDKGLAALPLLAAFEASLKAAGLQPAIYAGVFGNPTTSQVMNGAAAYRGHGADCVVGIGGGAALDVAKVVGLMATHPGDIIEYVWDHPQVRTIGEALPYFIALPTTSGTGSEVGRSSVISEEDTHVKRVVFSPRVLAQVVFADPALTLGLPPAITAATGMDALTHNVESYLSPAYHPLCDGIALEGTRLAARSLAKSVQEPSNIDARADMMMSSMMGAIAFQKDLGAVHSCAHALGTVCDMHHGLANALMIDTVLAWNAQAVPAKFDELAHAVGVSGGAAEFLRWLKALKQTIGIAPRLSAAGVKRESIPRLVEIATADICHRTNPRPVVAADFERLFEEAM